MSQRVTALAGRLGRFKIELGLLFSLAGLFTVTAIPI